jgi:uncharacterized membrane protein
MISFSFLLSFLQSQTKISDDKVFFDSEPKVGSEDGNFIHSCELKGFDNLFHFPLMLFPTLVSISKTTWKLPKLITTCSLRFSPFFVASLKFHSQFLPPFFDSLKVLPKLGRELDKNDQILFIHPNQNSIKKLLHSRGIPIRYLETLRGLVRNNRIKKYLLLEMISRTIKSIIASYLRKVAGGKNAVSFVLWILNSIFGTSDTSILFWDTQIKIHLVRKYSAKFARAEQIQRFVDKKALFSQLQAFSGIYFKVRTATSFLFFVLTFYGKKFSEKSTRGFSQIRCCLNNRDRSMKVH